MHFDDKNRVQTQIQKKHTSLKLLKDYPKWGPQRSAHKT